MHRPVSDSPAVFSLARRQISLAFLAEREEREKGTWPLEYTPYYLRNRYRGYPKNWEVPGYAQAPISLKFLMGFCSGGPSECTGQIGNP